MCKTRRILLSSVLLVALVACGDDNPTDPRGFGPQPTPLPPLTAPENLISSIKILYGDKVRTAVERRIEYEKLLAPPAGCDTCPAFLFDFMPYDEETQGTPDTWGRDQEIQATTNIFLEQANGGIYQLTLEIQTLPPADLNGRPGWKEIFATNVHLRLLVTPQSGFELNGGQAQFRVYSVNNRWYIGEWIDLPRLGTRGPSVAVESTTWGRIKHAFK